MALPTDGTALANIEQRVLELVDQTGTSPALVAEFVAAVDEARGGRRVGRILEQVRAHERALQRSATKWIAMTPKSFVRVVRIRAAERGIRNGESLADLAADLGFADQAHLTRDFGEQMGTSPAKWRLSDFFKTQALARPISMENPTEPNHE